MAFGRKVGVRCRGASHRARWVSSSRCWAAVVLRPRRPAWNASAMPTSRIRSVRGCSTEHSSRCRSVHPPTRLIAGGHDHVAAARLGRSVPRRGLRPVAGVQVRRALPELCVGRRAEYAVDDERNWRVPRGGPRRPRRVPSAGHEQNVDPRLFRDRRRRRARPCARAHRAERGRMPASAARDGAHVSRRGRPHRSADAPRRLRCLPPTVEAHQRLRAETRAAIVARSSAGSMGLGRCMSKPERIARVRSSLPA